MPYLGNPPAEAYTSTVKDSFSGDGSTTAFTLSQPSTTNDLRVVVENVIQDPTVAYSVSGTTLTFTSAPPTGTNNVYAVNLGPAVQTVVPPDGVTVTDLNAYADGAVAFTANRATSDGDIIDLQKDGTTVGIIGTQGGDIQLGTGVVGIRFKDAANAIQPQDLTTSSGRDAATDLGTSAARFKDLYLSGGAYLGGTGSSNLLDDYEEGDYTVSFVDDSGGTSSTTFTGYYTKIGNLVTINFYAPNISSTGMASGDSIIYNLPFTTDGGTNNLSTGSVITDNLAFVASRTQTNSRTRTINSSQGFMRQCGDGVTDAAVTWTQVTSGSTDLFVTLTYRAA